jgi:phosphate uptake regulator
MPLFGSRSHDDLDAVEEHLAAMLADDLVELDLVRTTLFEGAPVKPARAQLREADRRVNRGEREVRRLLVVHMAVAGPADSPALLTYMSIVKDVERIGDYAKNMMDLARMGVDFRDIDDQAALRELFEAVVSIVPEASEAFRDRDGDRARTLLAECERLLSTCNAGVSAGITSDRPGYEAVPRTLLYRYLKRVVAHTTNLLSAVVMPVDRLDYFDEAPEDREPEG